MFRRRKETPALPAPKTEDEAQDLIGFHDAMRAQNVGLVKQYRDRLVLEISAKSAALAACENWLEIEEPKGGVVVALTAVAAE